MSPLSDLKECDGGEESVDFVCSALLTSATSALRLRKAIHSASRVFVESKYSAATTQREMSRPPSWASEPRTTVLSLPLRQPQSLVPDLLLEIFGWLAIDDWEYHAYSVHEGFWTTRSHPLGRALVRATHVCRYWREIALENKRLWSNITLNETLSRDYNRIDREFNCRVQRTLGSSQPLRLSYHELYQDDMDFAVDRAGQSRPLFREQEESMTAFDRLYPILRECISRASTLILSGYWDTLSDLFGWEGISQYEPPTMVLHNPRPKNLVTSKIDLSSLPQMVDLTVNIRDQTAAIIFPEMLQLRRLAIHLDPEMFTGYPFQLPYDASGRVPSTDLQFPPLPQERQPSFPTLTHLELRIHHLQLDSLHHFLSNHSTSLVDMILDTYPNTLSLYPAPPSPIVLLKLLSLDLGTVTPTLIPHLNTWECPNVETLRMSIFPYQEEITSLVARNFSRVKHFTFEFPNVVSNNEGLTQGQSADQRAACRLLVSMLVEMDGLVDLTVVGWHYTGRSREEDWFKGLAPQRRSPNPVETELPEPAAKSRPSAMWTRISEEGLMVDEKGDPYPFSDVESSVSSDYSHQSREIARVQAYLDKQDAAERARLERKRRRASPSYTSSSFGEEADDSTRRPPPEYIPGTYYACRALERVRLERCVGAEKSMVFDFWAGRQFLYSHYVRTTYGSPGTEAAKPVDRKTNVDNPAEEEASQNSQSTVYSSLSSATDGPPKSPASPSSLHEHRSYAARAYKPTGPQLYPPPDPPRRNAALALLLVAEAETPSLPERVRPSPTITLVGCKHATHEELQDLLWRYYTGFYEPFRPRPPRSPSPIPLDERDLW